MYRIDDTSKNGLYLVNLFLGDGNRLPLRRLVRSQVILKDRLVLLIIGVDYLSPFFLVQLATAVQSLVDNMNNRAEDDIPSRTVTAASIMFTGPADRSRYLFGIENQMFSMSERWNKIAVNPASASSYGPWNEEIEGAAFHSGRENTA